MLGISVPFVRHHETGAVPHGSHTNIVPNRVAIPSSNLQGLRPAGAYVVTPKGPRLLWA
jgi:hypothetical protein